MAFIVSRLTATVEYTIYVKGNTDIPQVQRSIIVQGGADVMNRSLVTPLGVGTSVTDEELEALEAHPVFALHKSNGFVAVLGSKTDDPSSIGAGMAKDVKSAPVTEADFTAARNAVETPRLHMLSVETTVLVPLGTV